jgi:hypothetical protein
MKCSLSFLTAFAVIVFLTHIAVADNLSLDFVITPENGWTADVKQAIASGGWYGY